jgi:DNA replication and repair protein RecF
MSLAELRIQNLRCIEIAELEFAPDFNLISGPNGAGKTSVLEAIFLLGRGRSFRTRSTEKLIRQGQASLTVFGRSDGSPEHAAGVEVTREGTRARIDAAPAESLLALSGFLPVQSIDPEIHKLIDHGPERRRRWMDWLVFHVEPSFAMHWTRYQRALRQRNAALRMHDPGFAAWDALLVEHGNALSNQRRSTLNRLQPFLLALFERFSGLDLTVSFQTGWSQDLSLEDSLRVAIDRDRERGATTTGPHRADFALKSRGRTAKEILSRGQQKLAAVSMIVSQMQLLKAERGVRAALLLDDPAAELDGQNLRRLIAELATLETQMIATSLTPEIALFQAPSATFHVEQGRFKRL